MNFNLVSQQFEEDNLVEQFAEYTIAELRQNMLKLAQYNLVYRYCETLIIEYDNEGMAIHIIDRCQDKSQNLLTKNLPFELLIELKKAKDEVLESDWTREYIIDSILNLIVDNTLLYSSLSKFAYS